MAIFLLIVIGLLMFKLGVLTVIVSILTAVGQLIAFIISVFVIGYLLNKFLGNKSVHTLRKDQWRKL
jgi:O-antigen ligase